MISTVMVMIMVALASVFFLIVDAILKWGIDKLLLGL
jgi:preprotein translocase subunit SecE